MKKIKKVGRPKAENPKSIEIKTRITLELNNKLIEYCKNKKINKSELIRRGIEAIIKK